MWIDHKPVAVEVDDDNSRIFRPASKRSGFESPFRPEFFRPFSLLLKQR